MKTVATLVCSAGARNTLGPKGKTIMGTDPIQLLDDFQPIHPDVPTEDKQTP